MPTSQDLNDRRLQQKNARLQQEKDKIKRELSKVMKDLEEIRRHIRYLESNVPAELNSINTAIQNIKRAEKTL